MNKILNFSVGALTIFLVGYISDKFLLFFKIPIPSPILGIIIFFILLKSNIIKEKYIRDFCEFILKYMILFFIPAFVGIIEYSDIVIKNFAVIIATIFITTTLVLVITGLFVENIIKYKKLYSIKKGGK